MILTRLQFPYARSAFHLSRMGETGTAFWCLVRAVFSASGTLARFDERQNRMEERTSRKENQQCLLTLS